MIIVACIPAYNEERTIAKIIAGCEKHVDKVFVCDDGSTDMTTIIAERMGAVVIRNERNVGKGGALRALFKAARKAGADVMVTIDADDQHNPQDIPRLVEPIKKGEADIVIGSRFLNGDDSVPRHRKVVNKLLNIFTIQGVSDTQSGFRVYGRKAIQSILPSEMGMGVDSEILLDAANQDFVIMEVPIVAKYGMENTSKLNPFYHTLDVIFSVLKFTLIRHPLLFFGIPGMAFVVAGLYYLILTISLFTAEKTITTLVLTYGLIAFAITMFGLLALFTGIILFTISTVVRKSQG